MSSFITPALANSVSVFIPCFIYQDVLLCDTVAPVSSGVSVRLLDGTVAAVAVSPLISIKELMCTMGCKDHNNISLVQTTPQLSNKTGDASCDANINNAVSLLGFEYNKPPCGTSNTLIGPTKETNGYCEILIGVRTLLINTRYSNQSDRPFTVHVEEWSRDHQCYPLHCP